MELPFSEGWSDTVGFPCPFNLIFQNSDPSLRKCAQPLINEVLAVWRAVTHPAHSLPYTDYFVFIDYL